MFYTFFREKLVNQSNFPWCFGERRKRALKSTEEISASLISYSSGTMSFCYFMSLACDSEFRKSSQTLLWSLDCSKCILSHTDCVHGQYRHEDTSYYLGFPGGSVGKVSACNAGTGVRSLGWEDPLEKELATYSSILTWEIPWIEEPGGL